MGVQLGLSWGEEGGGTTGTELAVGRKVGVQLGLSWGEEGGGTTGTVLAVEGRVDFKHKLGAMATPPSPSRQWCS